MSSSLLMDEPPLQILLPLAKKIGLNEAIVLQQLHYLCEQSSFGKTIDGKKWIYNTYEEWRVGYFPFWSTRTIERVFQQLHLMALIETCQPEGRESRRKYYRLNEGMRERLWRGDIPDPANLADSDEHANLAPSEPAKLAPSCAGASNRTKTTAKTTGEDVEERPPSSLQQPPPIPNPPQSLPRKKTPPAPSLPKKKREEEILMADLLPIAFHTREFIDAWEGFEEHRRTIKAPLTNRARKLYVKDLVKWGLAKSIRSIEAIVKSGKWVGLFDPDERNGVAAFLPPQDRKITPKMY